MYLNVRGTYVLSDKEINYYVDYAKRKYGKALIGIDIWADNEDSVLVSYELNENHSERLARIPALMG